jgi:hypothetical protein
MQGIYIALDHCNLDWKPKDVHKVEQLWNDGASIEEIAKEIKRPVKDVFCLLYDRAELGFIESRKGGIFGAYFG